MPPKPKKPWSLKGLQQLKEKMPNLNEFAENSKKTIQKQYQRIRKNSFEDGKQELKEKAKKLSQYKETMSKKGSEQLNKFYQKSGKFTQNYKDELSKLLQSKKKDTQKYTSSIHEKLKNVPFLNKQNSNPEKHIPAQTELPQKQNPKNEPSKDTVDKQTKHDQKSSTNPSNPQKKQENGYLNFKKYSWDNLSNPVQRITDDILNRAQKIKDQSSQKFKGFTLKDALLEVFNKIYWKLIFGFCLVAFIYGIASQIPKQVRIYLRDTMSQTKKSLMKQKSKDDD